MPLIPEPEPAVEKGAPSASKTNRFPEDRLLRGHGFVIHRRPKGKPAVWRRGKEIFTHAEAMASVRAAMKKLETK